MIDISQERIEGIVAGLEAEYHWTSPNTEYARKYVDSIGDPALPVLLRAASSKSEKLRGGAARCLSKIKNWEAFDTLLVLLKDPKPTVRSAAAMSLGDFADPLALDALGEAMTDKVADVRFYVTLALHAIDHPQSIEMLRTMATDPDVQVASAVLSFLSELGDPDAPGQMLDVCLRAKKADWDEYDFLGESANVIAKGRQDVHDRCVKELSNPSTTIRALAATVLADLGTAADVPALLTLTRSRSKIVKRRATISVASIGSVEAIAAVSGLMKRIDDGDRFQIIEAFEGNQSAEAVELVAKWSTVDDYNVYTSCAWVLATQGQSGVDVLISNLRHGSPQIRAVTVNRLPNLGAEAMPAVLALLSDPDLAVRCAAIYCIGRSRQIEYADRLIPFLHDDNDDLRVAAARALAGLGDNRATPHLISLLSHSDSSRRKEAVLGLRSLANPEATQALIRALDRHGRVRQAAASALGWLGAVEAIWPLVDIVRESQKAEARTAAVLALGALGIEETRSIIQDACLDSDMNIVEAAKSALARFGERDLCALQNLEDQLRV